MSERHLIIGTAGHVDHGKTSLIKALTAIDCDTHKEEKERGITINLGFSHLELEDGTGVGIIDVPGHKDFIKTMVSGAHGIDLVLLVISADSGVMPQTKEHLNIIQMLDVQNGIVVLTKTDLVDEEMLELAQLEIEEYLEDTILSGAPVIPVSCMEGTGIPELRNVIENQLKRVSRMKSKEHFRMFVDRFFNVKGIGIVVTGSVLGGEVGEGDELYVLPDKTQKIKVKGVQRHGKKVSKIFAGDRAAINISGLSMDDYYRGMLLSSSDISPQGIIDARISLFQENSTLKVWSHAILLCGTYESRVRIHLLDRDKLEPPDDALVQIHLEQAFTFSKKDRFILRNTSNDLTIGGGVVFENYPLHHKRRTKKLLSIINEQVKIELDDATLSEKISLEVKKQRVPVHLTDLATILDVAEAEIRIELDSYTHTDLRVYKDDEDWIIINVELEEQCKSIVLTALEDFHAKNPMIRSGLELISFINKGGISDKSEWKSYLRAFLDVMVKTQQLRQVGTTWSLASHKVKINQKLKEQIDWLEKKFLNQGMQNPNMKMIQEWAKDYKITPDKMKTILQYLVAEKRMLFFDGEYVNMELIEKARFILLKEVEKKGIGLNEKEYREAIDGTKKFVQYLLKLFLAEGIVSKRAYYLDMTHKGEELLKKYRQRL